MASQAPGQKQLITNGTKTPENDFCHDIDPSGDLILEVGDPASSMRIRASSKALSLASPFFAAMFSPRFAESKPVSCGENRNITLLDDDPSAMITLCNVVHMKSSRVSAASFDAVEKLSILCDKYDCAEALSPWSWQWLSKWQGSMNGQDGYLKMIYVSYGFNDHDSFWKATSNVLKCYDNATITTASSNQQGFAILPAQLLDELNTHRKTLLQEIYKAIGSTIDPFLKESNARIVSHGFPQGRLTSTPVFGSLGGTQREAAPTGQFASTSGTQHGAAPTQALGNAFGRTSGTQPDAAPTGLFASTSGTQPGAAPTQASGSAFGETSATQRDAAPTGLFGSTSATQRDAAPPGLFGSTSATQRDAASPGLFGSTSATQREAPPPGLFGSTSATQRDAAHPGLFGSTSATQRDAAPTQPLGCTSGTLSPVFSGLSFQHPLPMQRLDISCSSAMKIGLLFLELSRLELWPLSDKVIASSVQDMLGKVAGVKVVGEPAAGCRCRTCKVGFKEVMTELAAVQLERVKGLCLGCARAGRVMPEGGNCQGKDGCVVAKM